MSKKVIIIGSGLGGLSCGVILAKNGYDVTVLEQASQIGGCLQCFTRYGAKFETGMHFVGSASKGQTLDRLMTYLEIDKDVELSKLDETGYDVVSLLGQKYKFANGREPFIEQMAEYFPKQRDHLLAYYNLVEKVAGASSLHSLKYAESDAAVNMEYQLRSINDVVEEVITDPLLAKVLVGNLPLYAAERDKTPFSTHAFIMDFYNQSAYRFVGGSDSVAKSMVATIAKYGGTVKRNVKVTQIVCDEARAIGVNTDKNVFYSGNYVISDAHPMRTLELLDTKLIRPAFRNRINSIPQTIGGFSVYLEFKENSVPYMNYNYYGYNTDTPWGCENYDEESWPKGFLYMHFCESRTPVYVDYENFKAYKTQKLLESLYKHFPEVSGCVKRTYSSTPLTYFDYTGSEGGSMYGIAKDINLGVACRVPHRTKIPNVFQTGQNINSHGMLGVLVGTIVTCSELLTSQKIYQQIINCK